MEKTSNKIHTNRQSVTTVRAEVITVLLVVCGFLAGCSGERPEAVVASFTTAINAMDIEEASRYTTSEFYYANLKPIADIMSTIGEERMDEARSELTPFVVEEVAAEFESEMDDGSAKVWHPEHRDIVYVLVSSGNGWKIDAIEGTTF